MAKKSSGYGGGYLGDGTPLNVAVYRAYRNAGLSHNQALAITAEVGRENAFNPDILFSSHTDPAGNSKGGKIRNVGMLSWNQGRDTQVLNYLRSQGVLNARTQANLDAQARFSVNEMKSDKYRHKLQHFWNNPNADPESFARELGKYYVVWAYGQTSIKAQGGGRVPFNSSAHDARRRGYLNVLGGMVGNFTPVASPYQGGQSVHSSGDLFFLGDSIAHGFRGKAKGITKVGSNPAWVLNQVNNILAKNPDALRGRTVVLSSGLSNNHKDLASVEKQLQTLKNAGANVMLLGVSNQFAVNGGNGKAMNDGLAGLASRYGAVFNGGFNAGRDGVHPSSYSLKTLNLGALQSQAQPQQSQQQDSGFVPPPVQNNFFEFAKQFDDFNPQDFGLQGDGQAGFTPPPMQSNFFEFAKQFGDFSPEQLGLQPQQNMTGQSGGQLSQGLPSQSQVFPQVPKSDFVGYQSPVPHWSEKFNGFYDDN